MVVLSKLLLDSPKVRGSVSGVSSFLWRVKKDADPFGALKAGMESSLAAPGSLGQQHGGSGLVTWTRPKVREKSLCRRPGSPFVPPLFRRIPRWLQREHCWFMLS